LHWQSVPEELAQALERQPGLQPGQELQLVLQQAPERVQVQPRQLEPVFQPL
jgi:hypothetical protein